MVPKLQWTLRSLVICIYPFMNIHLQETLGNEQLLPPNHWRTTNLSGCFFSLAPGFVIAIADFGSRRSTLISKVIG